MKSKQSQSLVIILLLLTLLLSACAAPVAPTAAPSDATTLPTPADAAAESTAASFPLTITDAIGQEFTFDAPPKIGCYWYGCYEALADLGVPVYAGSLAPEELESVFYMPVGPPTNLITDDSNPESWAAAEIDLFVTRVPDNADLDAMRQAAPIFFLHHPSYGESDQQGYQSYLENLRLLGLLTGQPAAADAAIARFETALTNLKALSTPALAATKVAMLFEGEGYGIITPDNPFCVALAEVGLGQCVGEGVASWEINAEEFLKQNPDWIGYQTWGGSYQARTDPVWSQLTAVKAGRVYDAGHRYYCCSTRGLIHAFQEYVSHVLPDAGIPAPGPVETFDPTQSPLVTAATATTDPTAAGNAPRVHTDAFGREVALPANPQRIVAHYFAADMVALGLPMIGTNYVNAELLLTPEQLADLTDTGTGDPHVETILTLNPDLIFVPDFTDAGVVDLLAEIAPTVVIPYSGDPFDRLRLFGDLVGQPDAATAWIDAYNAKAAAKQAAVAPFIAQGESAIALIMYGDGQLYLYGRPRLGPTLYDVFGFTQPPAVIELFRADPNALWQTISLELLPNYAGDRIFLVQTTGEDAQTATAARINGPIWQSLPAVQNGKVYYVEGRWALNDPLTLDWLLDEMAAALTASK